LEEIFMSKLLRELTDKEIQSSLSNGGSTCSMYKALLPGHIAACAVASAYFYGSSGCTAMRYVSEYIRKNC
jgi:hypothetical protein